jgi:hypothetical protein
VTYPFNRLQLAEAVEKFGAIRNFAMIVREGRPLSHIDSFARSELNHCFKKFGHGDFFNSLSRKRTLALILS